MGKTTAKDVLTGTDVTVFLDGEEIGTWTSFEATVTINYEDVQIGMDVDRKAVSWQGDGRLAHQATNSIGAKLFNKMQANRDARYVIEGEMTKRSTGETQFTSLPGCTFDEYPLATWSKGELVENDMAFRFLPSQVQNTQLID